VTNIGIVGDPAGRGASDSDFVLRAREKVLADALGIGALIKGLPTCKKNKTVHITNHCLTDVKKLAISFGKEIHSSITVNASNENKLIIK
jgi:hypothetical protein